MFASSYLMQPLKGVPENICSKKVDKIVPAKEFGVSKDAV